MSIEIVHDTTRTATAFPENSNTRQGHKEVEERVNFFKDSGEEKKDETPKDIEGVASEVQIQLKRLNTELRFEVDKDTKDLVIKIIDPETKEIIRQIPSEELLAIRSRMKELIGVLYDAET
ncbi:MAG: flagellar protein FlaG [Deltaproteobacteria bacterium]|nr:flagellar protein FlaG [Deltaproteobacteria bacterium]